MPLGFHAWENDVIINTYFHFSYSDFVEEGVTTVSMSQISDIIQEKINRRKSMNHDSETFSVINDKHFFPTVCALRTKALFLISLSILFIRSTAVFKNIQKSFKSQFSEM